MLYKHMSLLSYFEFIECWSCALPSISCLIEGSAFARFRSRPMFMSTVQEDYICEGNGQAYYIHNTLDWSYMAFFTRVSSIRAARWHLALTSNFYGALYFWLTTCIFHSKTVDFFNKAFCPLCIFIFVICGVGMFSTENSQIWNALLIWGSKVHGAFFMLWYGWWFLWSVDAKTDCHFCHNWVRVEWATAKGMPRVMELLVIYCPITFRSQLVINYVIFVSCFYRHCFCVCVQKLKRQKEVGRLSERTKTVYITRFVI